MLVAALAAVVGTGFIINHTHRYLQGGREAVAIVVIFLVSLVAVTATSYYCVTRHLTG